MNQFIIYYESHPHIAYFYYLDLDSINPFFLLKFTYLWGGVSLYAIVWAQENICLYSDRLLYCEGRLLSYDTFHLPMSSTNWQRRSDAISCQIMSLLSRAKTRRYVIRSTSVSTHELNLCCSICVSGSWDTSVIAFYPPSLQCSPVNQIFDGF
jgi:hypothetical protein